MDFQVILAVAGAVAGCFLGGRAIMKMDSKREDRAEEAIDLAVKCSENGLPGLGVLLKKYAVKDYNGMVSQFRTIAASMRDDASAKEVIRTFLQTQLERQLSRPDTAEDLLRMVEDRLGVKIDRPSIEKRTVELVEAE